ncbi:palmitoyltransferase swf1 [Coemansia sp. RSA 2607]|nr:palmitoyltransferase swf1 [Coemansia sp. RSA 2607]
MGISLFTASWVTALLAFCAWVSVLLLGRNRMFRGTVVERANIYCLETLPANANRWMRVGISDAFVQKAESVWIALFGRRNPVFQIFAIVLYFLGLTVFMTQAAPAIPNRYVGSWHWITITLTLAVNMGSYAIACMVDPGYVDAANVDRACSLFELDGLLYSKNTVCRTCHLRKPARSKHCSACGRCIQMMDHHCMWLNNCIGLNNARWFLAFLTSFSAVCVYGTYLFATVILELRHVRGLTHAMVQDEETGEMVPLSFKTSILFLLDENVLLAVIMVLLLILTPAIGIFTLYQLRIVSLGYTGNEEIKWLNVADDIKDEVLFVVNEGSEHEAYAIIEKEDQQTDPRPKRLVTDLSQVANKYHRGVWENLRFVLFASSSGLKPHAD